METKCVFRMNFVKRIIPVDKPTTIYMFSDGFPDQFGGPKGRKFLLKNLKKLLLEIHSKSMDEQKKILEQTLAEWVGDKEQIDDILVIGAKI